MLTLPLPYVPLGGTRIFRLYYADTQKRRRGTTLRVCGDRGVSKVSGYRRKEKDDDGRCSCVVMGRGGTKNEVRRGGFFRGLVCVQCAFYYLLIDRCVMLIPIGNNDILSLQWVWMRRGARLESSSYCYSSPPSPVHTRADTKCSAQTPISQQ